QIPAHARREALRPIVVGEPELDVGRTCVGFRRRRKQVEGCLHLGLRLRLELGGAGIVRVPVGDPGRLVGEGVRPLDLDKRESRDRFREARPRPGDFERVARLGLRAGGCSSAGSGDRGDSARAAGSGVGTAAGAGDGIRGCAAPNIIVDRATSPGLAAGFGPGAEMGRGTGGTGLAGDSPKTMVAPAVEAAAGLAGAGAFFAGAGARGTVAVGNIMVRP